MLALTLPDEPRLPTMQSSPPSTESATALTIAPTSHRVDHALTALEHNSYTRRCFAIGVSTSVSNSLWLAWGYPTSHVVHAPACPAEKTCETVHTKRASP